MTIKNAVILAMNLLHNETKSESFTLKEIYIKTGKILEKKEKQLEHSIRREIYAHSSDSEYFQSKDDIFFKKDEGVWGIREYLSYDNINNLKKGKKYTKQNIMDIFKVSGQEGIMISNTYYCVVLISNEDKKDYFDEINENSIIYTGQGKENQKMDGRNYKILRHKELELPLYFFVKKKPNEYYYYGEVYLYDKPYEVIEKDRTVWKFPLKIKDETNEIVEEYILKAIEAADDFLDQSGSNSVDLYYDETELKLSKYNPPKEKSGRTRKSAPDYIALAIEKDRNGKKYEKKVLEREIQKLMEVDAKDCIKKMEDFFYNKKEDEGYDILSFEISKEGKVIEKYIEVKSTKGGETTPIDLTYNELKWAKENSDNYYIYRIYNCGTEKETLKIFKGDPSEKFDLIPTSYRLYSK